MDLTINLSQQAFVGAVAIWAVVAVIRIYSEWTQSRRG